VLKDKGTFRTDDRAFNKKLIEKNELVAFEETKLEEKTLPNIYQNH
jgi:hypothetical protein